MIRILAVLTLILSFSGSTFCQIQGFKYQGLAKLGPYSYANDKIDLFIEIGKYVDGNEVRLYMERHTAVPIVNFVFSIIVGTGKSMIGNLEDIDWREENFYLKPTIFLNSRKYEIPSSPIVSVPLALYARNSSSWSVVGNTTIESNYDQVKAPNLFATSLTSTSVLEIRGGSDIVEEFIAEDANYPEPGDLVSLGESSQNVTRTFKAYDPKVVGVVSGANGLNYGLKLVQSGHTDGDLPIAIAGRVYVKAVDINGVINPGDLLVSSKVPGHVMKLRSSRRAIGTVVGKALTCRDNKTGLVLMLAGAR